MSNEAIMFVGFGRLRDQLILASVFDRLSTQEKNDIDSSFRKFLLEGLTRFSPGSRDKKSFPEGTMFLMADPELCCVHAIGVRGKSYPDRVAYACLQEIIQLVANSEDSRSLNTVSRAGSLTRAYRKDLKDAMDKYDKPSNVDKAAEVAGKVEQVKGQMQENISKVIATHANIEQLDIKTDNLNQNAQQFNENATDLSRMMWWQKTKVTIMLVIVGIAILAYIALTIVKYTT